MFQKIEPFLFGIYYVFLFVSVFVFVFRNSLMEHPPQNPCRPGRPWMDCGWFESIIMLMRCLCSTYAYALYNMHNMLCFFAPSHDVGQWLCLINHCVCPSCFLPSLPAQTLLSMMSNISPTRRLSLVINKHCVFLQLHNMKYVCLCWVDDKNLAGFGSRSFDMQETGRESEEPADLGSWIRLSRWFKGAFNMRIRWI